jgi:ribosomal small subunit protein bTHX
MGKGDIKSKRGKIANGSYGTRRKKSTAAPSVPKPKVIKEKKVTEEPAAKKSAVRKAPAKKKAE